MADEPLIDLSDPVPKLTSPLKKEEVKAEEYEEEDTPIIQSFISTTANGDGLEFDKRLPNIFDEIDSIKSDKPIVDFKPKKVTIEDDEGLTLD